MSSITFSGLGSGMDYASWVDALVEAKKATTVTPLETKLESLNNSKEALGIVEQYFQEYQTALAAFTDLTEYSSNDIFNSKAASSSMSDYLSATCTAESAIQDYVISVKQMATQTTTKSATTSSEYITGDFVYSDLKQAKCGTFSICVGSDVKSITIDETKTMDQIVSDINALYSAYSPANPIDASIVDGKIQIQTSTTENVILGLQTDTSNFKDVMKLSGSTTDASGYKVFTSSTSICTVDTSAKITSEDANLIGTITAGTIKINDVEFTIDENTTINSLINTINSNQNVGVTASYDANSGFMTLTSKQTGNSAIKMEDVDATNFFNIMNLSNSAASTTLGNQAIVTINGTQIESSSNKITNTGYEGLSLEVLMQPAETDLITISITEDSKPLKDSIKTFVEKYNQVLSAIKEATANDGYLEYDSTLRSIYSEMRSIAGGVITNDSEYNLLSQLGISTGDAGLAASDSAYKLVFDEKKLDEVLAKSTMGEIKSIFTNSSDTGAMDRFKTRIDNTLAPTTGYFDSKESSYSSMIKTQQNRIDRANEQLVLYEEVLLRQFQAMDQAIADMNSQYASFVDSIAQLSG